MELYRLKSFSVIEKEGNLTRAAERLHLSQSALSSQIKQLEEDLGVSLFRRTSKGMALTEAGRELSPLIQGTLDAAEKLRNKARLLQHSGGETVNIGLNTEPAFLRVGAVSRRLSLLDATLNLLFLASPTVRTAQMLRDGELDLAFFYGESAGPEIRHLRLAEVRLCIVIPKHLVSPSRSLDWSDVAALPWVWVGRDSPPYAAIQEEFERRRLTPQKAVNTVDEYIVRELVVDGRGAAVMREDEARPLAKEGRVVIWEKGWISMPLRLGWMAESEDKRRVRIAREAVEYAWRGTRLEEGGGPGAGYLY